MTDEQVNHPQEPAEAEGAQPPHPEELAEGSSEDVEAPGAERAGKPTRRQRKPNRPSILWNPLKEARKTYKPPEPSEPEVSTVRGVGYL